MSPHTLGIIPTTLTHAYVRSSYSSNRELKCPIVRNLELLELLACAQPDDIAPISLVPTSIQSIENRLETLRNNEAAPCYHSPERNKNTMAEWLPIPIIYIWTRAPQSRIPRLVHSAAFGCEKSNDLITKGTTFVGLIILPMST